MRTPLFFTGSSTSNVSNAADRYAPISVSGSVYTSFTTPSAGFITSATQFPTAGTISLMRVRFPTVLTQGSYTITLMTGATQNAMTATALSCTIGTSSTDAVDLVNSVTVAAGDYAAWKVTPSGTPTAQANSVQIATMFDATTAGRSVVFSGQATGTAAAAIQFGGGSANSATEATTLSVMPIGGTITKMYASLNANAGAPGAGNSRTVTLRKGTAVGGLSDTAMTVTFGATETEKLIDLTGSPITFAAGDFLSIAGLISGTPVSTLIKVSFEIIPATSGQSLHFANFPGALSATVARFGIISGSSVTADATEANSPQIAPAALTIKSMRVDTTTAPGTAKTRTARLRQGAGGGATADTALTAVLTDAAITVSASTDVAVAGGDTLLFSHTPASSPTSSAWTSIATVIEATAGAPAVNFTPSDRSGQTFEGIRNASKVLVGGAYSGTPTDVQVSLWDAASGGTQVSAWVSATVQTSGLYAHTFDAVAVGGPYYHRVRDNGGTATNSTADVYVGAVVVLWGQSQAQKLHTDDISGLTPSNGMQVRITTYSSQTNVGSATSTITKYDSTTTGLSVRTGSGVVAIAERWHAETAGAVPLMIVVTAYQGTSIEYWVNDRKGDFPTNADVTTLWGTSPTTGFAWFMAAAARYQASAIIMLQGTADVGNDANVQGSGFTYAQLMDQLKAKFEALYNGTAVAPLFLVVAHARSDDGPSTWQMRAVQYAKAISGGTWRLCAWLLDWQMDLDGSPHQKTGATGNIRGGTRIGRGLAKALHSTGLDIAGPQIVSAVFNGGRTAFDVTFDRDIETPSAVTTGIQGVFVSTDSGATFPTAPASITWTVALTAARVARVTSTGAAFPAGTTRFDFFRGIPFASDLGAADLVGAETDMETNVLSKVIVDTTAFDGGRGMPVAPVMGTGFAVASSGAVTIEGAAGAMAMVGGAGAFSAGATVAGAAGTLAMVGGAGAFSAAANVVGVAGALGMVGSAASIDVGIADDPTLAPISLAEAKLFLRVDGDEEDALISDLIRTAAASITGMTGIVCRAADQVRMFNGFASRLPLRRAPVNSIVSVEYLDADGMLQTLAADQYRVSQFAGAPVLVPVAGPAWPAAQATDGAVVVTVNAGYASNLVADTRIRTAARLLVGHWYSNRSAVNIGNITSDVPVTVDYLLADLRLTAI